MMELESAHGPRANGAALARFVDGHDFEARVFERDGTRVVAVAGEIDMATAGLFRQAMDEACTGSDQVVIDLADTTFIDSTGLAVVVRALRQLGRQRDALVVRGAGAHIARIFEISGLDHLLTMTGP